MEFNNEIIDMSLDDYIAMSNKRSKVDSAANQLNSCNDFKFGRRKKSVEEEDEEDDEEQVIKSEGNDMKNDDVEMEIWKGPDASIAYIDCHDQKNDLREKLNSTKVTPIATYLEKISGVQNGQRYPNNNFDCPRGTSAIVPFNTQPRNDGFNRRNRNRNYRFNNNNFNRGNNHNNGNRNYMNHNNNNRNYMNHNNNNMNHNNNNNRNYMNHNNNNRNYMNHNNNDRNYMNFNNKNFQNNGIGGVRTHHNSNQNLRINTGAGAAVNNGNNNGNLKEAISPGTSKNLIIEFPSNTIKLGQQGDQHKSCFQVPNAEKDKIKTMPVGSLTRQAEAALNLETPNTPPSNSNNDNLKSLLGFQGNVSADMMPVFASKLMEFLQNGTQAQVVHKPIYDMKIQKDIHEIQNKPLLYKCNGGEVISADGAGVNCKVTPRSSGISLNCRFA